MKAEALIGRTLGTCTLQKLIGQGGMGAVFLAQQSRPRRQVAVKVLLPLTQLNANQLAAFLERFRRETDAAASLEHPNIIPIHEYGEQDGIAYLVMPYVAGGTLRDVLERSGPLSFQKAVDYLEQLSAALDFAHEHGVIHRDIKPANIMVTNEGRLLLGDFGLVKIVVEGQTPQVRLTGAGAPVGTPDYMSPEQVIGEEIDTRADLYSLGVILFQLLTGTTPFQGETPMQIAAQHLQIPPPSPQMLRPDLPIAAEQVVLRAMSKRPGDRYMRAQDMAKAFRASLVQANIILEPELNWAGLLSGSTASRLAIPKGQFDPIRQTFSMPKVTQADLSARQNAGQTATNTWGMPAQTAQPAQPAAAAPNQAMPRKGTGLLSRTGMMPALSAQPIAQTSPVIENNRSGGLLSKTGQFSIQGTNGSIPAAAPSPAAKTGTAGGGLLSRTGQFPRASVAAPTREHSPAVMPAPGAVWSPEPTLSPMNRDGNTALQRNPTNALALQESPRRNTVKLNDPVKVVQVPVAGQPGRYITGILPFERQGAEEAASTPPRVLKPWMKTLLAAAIVLIVLGGLGAVILTENNASSQSNQAPSTQATAQALANSPAAQATATATANILVADPLDKQINNWRTIPANLYAFKDGAYHVTDSGTRGNGVALPGKSFSEPFTYSLTMQEIKGDDNNQQNTFGMILCFNQQTINGKPHASFYSLEVSSAKGQNYTFWRYDDSKTNYWTKISDTAIGNEFHRGKASNTISITMVNGTFTITVNGKQLAKVFKDNTYKSGSVGMLVNNNGTEVAFKDLLVTRK